MLNGCQMHVFLLSCLYSNCLSSKHQDTVTGVLIVWLIQARFLQWRIILNSIVASGLCFAFLMSKIIQGELGWLFVFEDLLV